MRVHVLGASGTYPVLDRPASGYVVEEGDTRVLLDAGPGVMLALLNTFELADLAAIVVSHRHPDHCSDLFAVFHRLAYGPAIGRSIPLYAPTDTIDAFNGFLSTDTDGAFQRVFEIGSVEEDVMIGDVELSFAPAHHSVPAVCVRVAGHHRTLVYTGDTGEGGTWASLASGADLLLAEASLQNGDPPWPYHLSAASAGRIARRQGVKRLALTHIRPDRDPALSVEEAESTFDRPVQLAVPGGIIDL